MTRPRPWSTPIALAGALALAALALTLFAPRPGEALWAFFLGPFTQLVFWGHALNQAMYLCLTAWGVSLAFQAGRFNLGGEGQTYLGALAAVVLALGLPPELAPLALGPILLAAAAAGALPAWAAGWLKAKWDITELISTFLMSAALIPLIDAVVLDGSLREAGSYLLGTRSIDPAFWIAQWAPPSRLNVFWAVLPGLALALWLFFRFSLWGYRWRLVGLNPLFAHSSGVRVNRYTRLSLGASGALHGLAGGVLVLGSQRALLQGATAGLGWNGVTASLMARHHPLAIIPAALFLAYLDQAGRTAVILAQFPFELGGLLQGLILLLVTAQSWPWPGFPGRRTGGSS